MSRPVVLSGPSGCGKSTILQRMLKEHPDKYAVCVSHTTRKPRPGERHGVEYYFTTRPEMEKAIERGEFLEHAEFGGNLYGTSFEAIRRIEETGKRCILDIEIQGVRAVRNSKLKPICILLKPPSMEALESRLRSRGTETEDAIQKRLKLALKDLSASEAESDLFDYIIINDDLDQAYNELCLLLSSKEKKWTAVLEKPLTGEDEEGPSPVETVKASWLRLSQTVADGKEPEDVADDLIEVSRCCVYLLASFKHRVEGAEKLQRRIDREISSLEEARSVTGRNLHEAVFCSNLKQLIEVFVDRDGVPLIVDVVANGGATWIKVIAREPSRCFSEMKCPPQPGRQNLLAQAEQFLETAVSNIHWFKPPIIVFRFCHGAAEPLVRRLLKLGVKVQGSLVHSPERYTYDSSDEDEEEDDDYDRGSENQEISLWDWESYATLESFIERETLRTINLDVSTMMTYVSDMCFGGSNYAYKEPLINMQAEWERASSVWPFIDAQINPPRKLICCQTAVNSFLKILDLIGGPEEKSRASNLLARVEVVEDCVSERTKKLTLSGKIKQRTIIIFGTGDSLKAVTITGNRAFLDAAKSQGVSFAAILHEPRALTEKKRFNARPLSPQSGLSAP